MVEPVVTVLRRAEDVYDDERLCTAVGAVLWKHYPDWNWHVDVPPRQNIVIVRNTNLSQTKPWGFVLHKSRLSSDLREIVWAGGEILERYNVHRGRMRVDELAGRRLVFETPEM